jgi:thioester reductase-like protein
MLLLSATRLLSLFLLLLSTNLPSVQAFIPLLPTSTSFTVQLSQTQTLLEEATTVTTTATIMKAGTEASFREKTVLLTGASGGLGRSLALELATCGVGTLVLSARRKDALQEVAAECQSLSTNSNLKIHILTCDLADPASVTELGDQAVKACPKGIDVLINNGGVSSRSTFLETDASVDQKLMQVRTDQTTVNVLCCCVTHVSHHPFTRSLSFIPRSTFWRVQP